MKKLYAVWVLLCLCVLWIGCGKDNAQAEQGEDVAGSVVVLEESTKEIEKEEDSVSMEQQSESDAQIIQPPTEVAENTVQTLPEENGQEQVAEETTPEAGQEMSQTEGGTQAAAGQEADNNLQIVFLGDSILDGYRDETGIAYLTGQHCGAEVYNLAMGGTSAGLTTYERGEYEQWDSRSLQGVVHVLCGNVNSSLLDGTKAGESYELCDVSNTDYFVIEYGMNDFLKGIPLHDAEDFYDEYTYVGALRIAVTKLRESFPNATIVLCAPNYAHFWHEDGSYMGDGNMASNGLATLVEYANVCGNVAHDMNTLFLDAYDGIGLDAYTADDYLEDGLHLSAKGRAEYARVLSKVIMEYEETKNN